MDKKQPGVMLYFDIRPSLKRLTTQEKGELFEAILDYGEFGVVPELDGLLGIAWDFIQPRLDRDRERYGARVIQRKYAAYSRHTKEKGGVPLSFEDWSALTRNGVVYTNDDSEQYETPKTPARGSDNNFEELRRQRMAMLK